MKHPVALVLGPRLEGVSGVSTHLNLLLGSALREDFRFVHFQVGSEGRNEGPLGRLLRLVLSPLRLAASFKAMITKSRPMTTAIPGCQHV